MSQTEVHSDIDRRALGLFRRSTIRARLTGVFLAPAFALGLQGALGMWQLHEPAALAQRQPSAQVLPAFLTGEPAS